MSVLFSHFKNGGRVQIDKALFATRPRVLNLAPHPDDFDVAGVTFRRMHDAGCDIHLAVLTSGAAGVQDTYCTPPDWETKSVTREQEQRNSCRWFGLGESQFEFLRMEEAEDGELLEDDRARTTFKQLVEQFGPDIVVIPHGLDSNGGHRRTYRLVMDVLAEYAKPVLVFCCLDPKTLEITPNAFCGFDEDEAAWKRDLLLFHDSQQARNLQSRGSGFTDRILGMNAAVAEAHNVGAPFAEAFEVKRMNEHE